MNSQVIDKLRVLGVFPIIVIQRAEDCRPLAESLLEAGLPCAEVTFRTAAAAESLQILRREFPELLLGAGTILTEDQAKSAFDSGAEFVVAPGSNPKVVDFCLEQQFPIFPGVCTPTEMEIAVSKGLTVLKFFPSEAMGGVRFLKAVSGPLPMIRFLPTGGVNLENLPGYLNFDRVLACAGTWIVRKEWLEKGEFARIRQAAQAAVRAVSEIRGGNHE